jgi:hypothetical protein
MKRWKIKFKKRKIGKKYYSTISSNYATLDNASSVYIKLDAPRCWAPRALPSCALTNFNTIEICKTKVNKVHFLLAVRDQHKRRAAKVSMVVKRGEATRI